MVVGICRIDLRLAGGDSLKEKRKVVRRVVERTRERFGVSIAEVGDHDVHRRAQIGLAIVGNEARQLQSMIDQIVAFVASNAAPGDILRKHVEMVHTDADQDWTPMADWDEDEEEPQE